MKKFSILFLVQFVLTIGVFAQGPNLGLRSDLSMGYYQINYNFSSNGITNSTYDNVTHIKFHNGNFRYRGSAIGSLIWDEDTRFFIGEYFDFGFGVGMGKRTSSSGNAYDGKTFDVLFGMSLGGVAAFGITDEISLGIKVIALGADFYFDFDQNPTFRNGVTFHPVAQYGPFWFSAGFGGKSLIPSDNPYKTYDAEFKFRFGRDGEESKYLGLRYQLNKYDKVQNDYRYAQKISSMGVCFGFTF